MATLTLLLAWAVCWRTAALAEAPPKPSDTPARDLVAAALTEISGCRTLDRAGVQAAWDKMAQGLAILMSQPGKWDAHENRMRGNVEWLLRAGAARAKTFGRIDSITVLIVRSRRESLGEAETPALLAQGPSAIIIQPLIMGTLRPECLRGNTTQILLWRAGDKVRRQAFVYGLDRPRDWSLPFRREITQMTAWRWKGALVLGIGSAVERGGVARHPEFLVLRQEKNRWVVSQRITSDEEGYPAWAADVDGDKADEIVLRTSTWPKSEPFGEGRSSPHVYYDTTWERQGEVFEPAGRRQVASPYAALCDFALALRRGDEAGAARLAATDEAVAQAKAARLDSAAELRALSALRWRVEFEADGKPFVAKMVSRDGQWLVSSIAPKPTPPTEGADSPA